MALNCYSTLLIHKIQPGLTYLFPKGKSHLLGSQFGNNTCCKGQLQAHDAASSMRRLQCSNIAGTSVLMLRGTKLRTRCVCETLMPPKHPYFEKHDPHI